MQEKRNNLIIKQVQKALERAKTNTISSKKSKVRVDGSFSKH